MKSSKVVGVWRPVMGVAVVGTLALGISALAGPRGTDQAVRDTGKGGTKVTQLVTGAPAQINTVVAGAGTTLKLAVVPVNPPPGMAGYPAGVSINGNELTIDRNSKEGFRAWFHVQISDWDPNGDGLNMQAYQVKIDCTGYYRSDCLDVNQTPGDGQDLVPAIQACATNADCRSTAATGFGESWARCTAGFCENGYLDSSNVTTNTPSPEGVGKGWCANDGCAGFGVAVGTCNYNYFGVSDNALGKLDEGGLYYGGTLVLDLPAGAKGKYTVALNTDETFAAAPGTPPIDIPTVSENGFVVNYVTGSCCYLLGTAGAGCTDGSLVGEVCPNRSDCAALGAPFVFTPGGTCAAPPSDDGCVECVVQGADPLCDDGDACTTESCNAAIGVCVRGFIAGYNPVKGGPGDTGNCCDSATGTLTDKDDGDACTVDSCSAADNRGSAVHSAAGALGLPCDDGNSCAVNDSCNGIASEQDGGCVGTPVNGAPCVTDADCQFGGQAPTATCSADNTCFCTVTPKVTFNLDSAAPKTCAGGFNDGDPCAKDSDCPGGGVCDLFPANCFSEDEKITALVTVGSAAEPVNGGQFLINYDPSCVSYNSATCLPPLGTLVYGPIVDTGAGTIFIACGVDPFGKLDGPLGNTNIVALSFTMIGQCNNCELSFGGDIDPGDPGSTNPMNTYLVDDGGYKMPVETQPKEIAEYGVLELNVPENISVNSDCDVPAAVVTWDAPSVSFSCGDATLTCRGAHESGLALSSDVVNGGGLLPQGNNSFCCYAQALDKCEQTAGCQGDTNNCPGAATGAPEGCWTVNISDETAMDIHVQLEPPLVDDEITRCIEFCLYGNCAEEPYCFQENVLFGGLYSYIGKANGKIKVPKGKWGCITAQDQLHSLRSCDIPDCIDGQLVARFKGDPTYGGNWLIMGNLDAWKKGDPNEDPSLDVIDILDFGKFIAAWGDCYEDRKYGCHEQLHADIDGDGCVGPSDYAFINRNFLVSSKDCCCGPAAADLPPALAEVTIEELRQLGHADLIVADLNGDGVLNADDMEAFTQGTRPVKSNIRKSGKGLRSGR